MSQTIGIHVLHVDDELAFADMAAEMLERENDRFTVETVTSANEGVDRLAADEFDCIVSDYDMPGQNGIEFLETVREDHPELPFILFTGKGSEEVASDAISAGVTDYLQKGGGTDQYTVLANRVRNAVERYRAQQARDRQHEAIESAQEGISILNEDGEFIYVNETYADLYGYDPEEMLGEHWELIYPDDEVALTREEILPTVAEEGYWHGETTGLRADGTTFPEDHVVSETASSGLVCTVRDLSDRRERETELRMKTRAMDEAPVGITITDPSQEDNPLIYVNDRFEELTGYDRTAVLGQNCRFLQGENTAEEQVADMRDAIDAEEPVTVELRNYRKDGTEFWNRVTIAPVVADGDVTNYVGFQEDTTNRKEREQAIEKLHSTARAFMEVETAEQIADITVDAVCDILDLPANGFHLYDERENRLVPVGWTNRTEEIVGTPPSFAPGEGIAWTAFETDEAQIYDDISTVSNRYNPDTNVRSQIVLPLDDHGVLVIGSPEPGAFDDTDTDLARTLAAHATTALSRIKREQSLQEEREFIEKALDSLDDLFYVVGTDGTLRRWNERAIQVTGYTDEELADMPATELFPDDDHENIAEGIEETLTTEDAIVEADLLTKDGERIPHEFTGSRLTDSEGDPIGLIGIGRDISDRKEREKKLTALHEVVNDLTASESVEQACESTIEASEQILDFDLSAIDIEEAGILRKQAVSGNVSPAEITDMPVEEGIAGKTYLTGESFLIDDLEAHDDADPQGPYKSAISVPIGEHGVFQAVTEAPTAFDNTDLELAEILVSHTESVLDRLTHEQELQRQNERLEQFASVVSHDLQNPLNVAQGRLELASEECDSDHLNDVARAHERMETLIDDLLTLARTDNRIDETEVIDITDMIDNCWTTVETADATLVTETDQTIQADQSRLKQLLENLFRNAVEHGGDDVTVTVGDLDDKNGFYVSDDGPGIPEDERDEVFEAGYSTTDEGTGFGLDIVEEIAGAHGWEISVTDSGSGGARFEITGVETAAE